MPAQPVELVGVGLAAMCGVPNAEFNDKHWGAAVMAAGLLAGDPKVPPDARSAIVSQCERLIHAKASFFDGRLPRGRSADIAPVAAALGQHAGSLHLLGHDTIFGTLALRAMTDRPEFATESAIESIVSMIEFAGTRGPGGPFPGWDDVARVIVEPDDEIPEITTPFELAVSAVTAFAGVGTVYDRRDRGVVQHVLTHAHALIELERLGHADAARAGIEAHRVYRKLLTRRPASGEDPLPAGGDVPAFRSAHYWRQDLRGGDGRGDWLFGHVFKVALAWTAVEPLLPPALEERARPMLATAMTIT
ncbi:MAG: hypothetical protein HKN41_05200 [Ilumatobacter sp.]|nr:hypothetical protein [Ilumatobacter sp.]